MLAPIFESILPELLAKPRWVVWKGPKVPYDAAARNSKASVSDPSTWSPSRLAQSAYEEGGYSGVGFVLNGDGIVGVDLDSCVMGGRPAPAALEVLEELGCGYVEVSPSGSGLRAFGYGERIAGCRGQVRGINVELYADKRYLSVTGRVLRPGGMNILHGFQAVAQRMGETRLQKSTEDFGSHLPSSSVGAPRLLFSSVGVVPLHTVPTNVGERNQRLFEYVRWLKGKMPRASRDELRPFVQAWYELAVPAIGTKDFGITFADFMHAWGRVRQPFGAILKGILESVDHTRPLPPTIGGLGYGPDAQRLVRVCAALQTHEGNAEFFLSARTAAEVIGIHFTEAAKLLRLLVDDGVLTLKSKGAGKKASRYRLIIPY